jgi:Glycosyl transferase family 2
MAKQKMTEKNTSISTPSALQMMGTMSKHFNINSCLEEKEKLALLNFTAKEFDLKQYVFSQIDFNSSVAAQFIRQQFYSQNFKADLIYWDYADLHSLDSQSVANYLKLLSRKGIVCVDGDDVAILPEIFCDALEPILETPNFSVYARRDGENPIHSMRYRMDIFRRKYFVETTRLLPHSNADGLPVIAVVVLAYCHEQYIAECLNSILIQKGNFRMRVIILDDASPDKTAEVARTVIAGQSNERIEFDLRSHPNNIGMVKNFGESIRLAADCDYLTFCEGDDFWSSDTRIQQHLDFLAVHSDCVMSFNSIEKCEADGSSREIFSDHANNPDDIINGLRIICAVIWQRAFTTALLLK